MRRARGSTEGKKDEDPVRRSVAVRGGSRSAAPNRPNQDRSLDSDAAAPSGRIFSLRPAIHWTTRLGLDVIAACCFFGSGGRGVWVCSVCTAPCESECAIRPALVMFGFEKPVMALIRTVVQAGMAWHGGRRVRVRDGGAVDACIVW